IFTSVSAARTGPTAVATATRRLIAPIASVLNVIMRAQFCNARSALQRRIDNGEPLLARLERYAGGAEARAERCLRYLLRAGRWRAARRRLRESGRARGVEGDIAFNLLHHLMDVAVEYGHRAEAFHVGERAAAVLGAPAPLRIDRPQRDMREHHDRRRRRAAFEIILDPFELLFAETTHATALEIGDIDETDEVHAIGIEAIITWTLGATAVAFLVELDLGVDEVVLAWHI